MKSHLSRITCARIKPLKKKTAIDKATLFYLLVVWLVFQFSEKNCFLYKGRQTLGVKMCPETLKELLMCMKRKCKITMEVGTRSLQCCVMPYTEGECDRRDT